MYQWGITFGDTNRFNVPFCNCRQSYRWVFLEQNGG